MKNSEKNLEKMANKIAVFEDRKVRRSFHKGEWYFSIIDIIRVLTESADPSRYWTELRIQLTDSEWFVQLFGKIEQLTNKHNLLRMNGSFNCTQKRYG